MTAAVSPFAAFAVALALLLAGYLLRLARWSVLMRQVGDGRIGEMFLALSLGYLVNSVVPLRLGEIVRGLYYASRVGAAPAFVMASIVVERTLDLVAVAAILIAFRLVGVFTGNAVFYVAAGCLALAAAVFVVALLTSRSARFRRLAWHAASVFNSRIQVVLLDTTWSVMEVFRVSRVRWLRIAVQSVAMWALYMMSYDALAHALGFGLQPVFLALVGTPLLPTVAPMFGAGATAEIGLLAYSVIPCLLFLAYVGAKLQFGVSIRGLVAWTADPRVKEGAEPRARTRFVEAGHYGDYLTRRFNGTEDLVSEFEGHAIGDVVVQRMLRGGSDALTVMVRLDDQVRIRKFASGGAADKLQAQHDWLNRYSNMLPIVRVFDGDRRGKRFFYDMEFASGSRDLYDDVHTYDVDSSWKTLSHVMGSMADFHAVTETGTADNACVQRYASEKVSANLRAIKAAVPQVFSSRHLHVNGTDIDLGLLDRFAQDGFLPSRLSRRNTATIHGDLTIENILTDPTRPNGWFLIDPNIGNVFESPLLDYAKLLQSLHLGYESLNRDASCNFNDHTLAFPNARSAQYSALYNRTTNWLNDRLGEDGLREVLLHEIVHYFRLTPYKFRKGKEPGMVFLGCLCLLVKQYSDRYETC